MEDQDKDSGIGAIAGVVTGVVTAIGVTLFAALGQAPAQKPAQPAAAVQAPATPAKRAISLGDISLAFADGKLTVAGTVPNAKVRDAIVKKAQVLFGTDAVVDALKIDASAPDLYWNVKPFDVLGKLKGLPGFKLALGQGNTATLEGVIGSEAAKADLGKFLETALVDNLKLTNNLKVDSSVGEVPASNVLFNESIEFAPASSSLPASADARVKLIAAALADDGRKLKVVGHTDNSGNPDANQELSLRRAEAVVQALVAAGAPAANLSAVGKGAAEPVADNATAAGRARNRRIAFQQ